MRLGLGILFMLSVFSSFGQSLQTPFIDSSFQRNYYNPSFEIGGFINIATGLSGELSTNGPVYNNVISKNSLGENYIDIDGSLNDLDDNNFVSSEVAIHTVDVGIKFGRFNLLAGHAWKINALLEYSQDLGLLIANGNAPYVGQTLDLGPAIAASAHNEIYLGGNINFGDVTAGVKIKHLSGVEDVSSEDRKIALTTSDDIYQIQIESDYLINTSRLLEFTDVSDFTFNFEGISFKNLFNKNTGLAVDLGLNWNLGPQTNIGLSVLDIGGITWDNAPENHLSQATSSYDGIDIISYIGDTSSIVLEDSLYNLLQFEKTQNIYSTKLPLKVIFTVHYELNDRWTLGGIIMRTHFREVNRTSIGLNGFMHVNRFTTIGVQYAATNGSLINLGLTGIFNLGPVQIFGTTDNIIAAFKPLDARHANIRLGVSFRI